MSRVRVIAGLVIAMFVLLECGVAIAQDVLPRDNGIVTYHTAPRWRESESHPLRVLAYIGHPVGWLFREVIFRPLSYFASSTETTRSVMGYREPYDYREPECFSADDSIPDCRSVAPFNYDSATPPAAVVEEQPLREVQREVYFPNVNFDFDVRKLNDLGRGQSHQIADLLKKTDGPVQIVLQGHADYKGSDAYNEKLGMDRAEAVRQELIALGIPAERLSTVSFGESRPIYAEQEDWARAVNRRVEVHVGDSKAGESPAAPVEGEQPKS